ncbi:putative DNA binding domain-containing protein [Sphingobacterium sp. DN04309]|uniref:DNA binding domain-containing protein n=1 Tax=Sphingobacterium litopenaei TaxID=2763500 RepID=A0ABR7YFD8_9SPHI|nr:putative DNA binding domain-containing protein [Sphingobacterium litopenaei]
MKDIVAFANTKGGYLIFGVSNNFEWIGLDDRSDNDCDSAVIADLLDSYCEGNIDFISNIIHLDAKPFFVIYVHSSNEILSFKKDGQYQKKIWGKDTKSFPENIFKRNDVYCRRNSRSIKADAVFFRKKNVKFKIIENVLSQRNLYNEFIGREEHLIDLHIKLKNPNNRIIQIDGIGGIGKTSFVHYFCEKIIKSELQDIDFEFIIWTSSKRDKYTPLGIKNIEEYNSNYNDLIKDIYLFIQEQGLTEDEESSDFEETCLKFLNSYKVLLIVDNLETLNDLELLRLLENFPNSSKAILTTRENLGSFFMARINLTGFKEVEEFPNFLDSQYKYFTNKNNSFLALYRNKVRELYKYTKGMPLAGQLICYQLANNIPIELIIKNLKSGDAYREILTFCFEGSISKLDVNQKKILYLLSLTSDEDYLSADDLHYISEIDSDEIGFVILPVLSSISLAMSHATEDGNIGYNIPHLAKVYAKRFIEQDGYTNLKEKYEQFLSEKKHFNDGDFNNTQLLKRSKARNHKETIAADKALRTLQLSNIDPDFAIEQIDELIKMNSEFPFLYLMKGKILDNIDHPKSFVLAKKEFLFSIDLDPNFLESYIELGYLEMKNRFGKNKYSKDMLNNAIHFFQKAIEIDPENIRANSGIAQAYTLQSNDVKYNPIDKEKHRLADLANEHYKFAYHRGDILTNWQKHTNAITSYNQSKNYLKNLRYFDKAMKCAEYGLSFEPTNKLLINIREEASFRLNPKKFAESSFREKGWVK